MRKFSPWYLLFAAALAAGSVVWLRDFLTVVMMISFTVSDPLYLKLGSTQQRKWLIPCGLVLALAFSSFYYIAELVVFPHSARTAYRLQDACWIGLLWAFAGLSAAYWSPTNKHPSHPA